MLSADDKVISVMYHCSNLEAKENFNKVQASFPNISCYELDLNTAEEIKQNIESSDTYLFWHFYRCSNLVGGVKYYARWEDQETELKAQLTKFNVKP